MILLDPGIVPLPEHAPSIMPALFSKMALSKPDRWASREEAANDMRKKPVYKAWDDEVFRSYIVCPFNSCNYIWDIDLYLCRSMVCEKMRVANV
jgi:hypothetical protein